MLNTMLMLHEYQINPLSLFFRNSTISVNTSNCLHRDAGRFANVSGARISNLRMCQPADPVQHPLSSPLLIRSISHCQLRARAKRISFFSFFLNFNGDVPKIENFN